MVLAVAIAAAPWPAAPPRAPAPAPELAVYAAASLRPALERISAAWEQAAGVRLVLNFAASNDLARQIAAAGKADLFVSADEAWMDHLASLGLIDAGSRRAFLSNRLVVVVPAGEGGPRFRDAAGLASPAVRRISLAHPEAVPAGRYARAWLEAAGVWEAVEPKIVPAVDARAALAAVEAGAADAGVVYRTDAAGTRRAEILFEAPEDESPVITYVMAAMAGRPHLERARAAARWLAGPQAAQTFRQLGFTFPPGAP